MYVTLPRTSKLPRALLVLMLLCAGSSFAQEKATQHEKSKAVGLLDFWPKRVNPDRSPLLFVQLSAAEARVQVTLDCGGHRVELGPPTWSHANDRLHAFDLEFTVPRTRQRCSVIASTSRKSYLSMHALTVRPAVAVSRVADVLPEAGPEQGEVAVEIAGEGFSDVVNVIWVSTDRFQRVERSARVVPDSEGRRVIVPFAPGLSGAQEGEYLLVVENEDRTASVSGHPFVVRTEHVGEVVDSAVRTTGDRLVLTVSGFELEDVATVELRIDGQQRELAVSHIEGAAIPTLSVSLPAGFSHERAFVSDLVVRPGRLVMQVQYGNRLTRGNEAPTAPRD